jgi:hypothetical protein
MYGFVWVPKSTPPRGLRKARNLYGFVRLLEKPAGKLQVFAGCAKRKGPAVPGLA